LPTKELISKRPLVSNVHKLSLLLIYYKQWSYFCTGSNQLQWRVYMPQLCVTPELQGSRSVEISRRTDVGVVSKLINLIVKHGVMHQGPVAAELPQFSSFDSTDLIDALLVLWSAVDSNLYCTMTPASLIRHFVVEQSGTSWFASFDNSWCTVNRICLAVLQCTHVMRQVCVTNTVSWLRASTCGTAACSQSKGLYQ
jgi:hypothetical protein